MKHLITLVCLSGAAGLAGQVGAAAPLASRTETTLVERGRAGAVVVADDRDAAAELVHYVQKVTGARLPVSGSLPTRVLIGPGVCPPDVRDRLRQLGRDGYVIEGRPDRTVVLAGNGLDGTVFAVYEFLERFAGVRWLWPGESGEVVPRSASLRIPHISLVRKPAFLWRSLGPGGALWGPLDKWSKERELGVSTGHQRLQRQWERRNRFGGLNIHGGHAMGEILPPEKYGPVHPEYFALVKGERVWRNFDGKHGKQPCTTNEDVIRITIEYCRRMFRERPELDGVSITPNDGRGFCECDHCRRLDSGAMMNDRGDPDSGRGGAVPIITDRILTFANRVAEGVATTNPGKKLLLYSYGQYARPPERTKAHPDLIVQYTMKASGWWDAKARETSMADLAGWSKAARSLGVYEYFTQTNFPDMPRLFPELIRQSVLRLNDLGYRFYQTQSGDGYAVNGLNQYVLARQLWDPHTDPAAVQRDYIEKGFGPAAPAVSRCLARLEEAWRSAADSSLTMNYARATDYRRVLAAYPASLRAACRRDLEVAIGLAAGQDRERVQFLRAGYRYFEMTIGAIEKTLPLLAAGWRFARQAEAPANPDMAAYDRSKGAWEERDRYIESLRDDFVLSYLWIRSNDETRTFNPLGAMRAYR